MTPICAAVGRRDSGVGRTRPEPQRPAPHPVPTGMDGCPSPAHCSSATTRDARSSSRCWTKASSISLGITARSALSPSKSPAPAGTACCSSDSRSAAVDERRPAGGPDSPRRVRCAIYTRKSTEEGLEQEFNSLEAQREAAEAYIQSQKHLGWTLVETRFDDGGFSGGSLDRPALQQLLEHIEARQVDCVMVYKVDRLSRSLLDFARLMDRFEQRSVSFVSVTQQFNTTTSLGRLTLNVLLSFAQFEREIIGERTRDKMSASRRKGKWVGGTPVLGYDVEGGRLMVNQTEARQVREIFELYRRQQSLVAVAEELCRRRWQTKSWRTAQGRQHVGRPFTQTIVRRLLTNVIYTGQVEHRGERYAGEHTAIVEPTLWE